MSSHHYILLLVSLSVMALNSGLITRFDDSTSTSTVVGMQVLFGMAAGCGALQATAMGLPVTHFVHGNSHITLEERMAWKSLAVFAEMLGGSVGISAAQAVFTTLLARGVHHSRLQLDSILRAGATHFREGLEGERSDIAVNIFNNALTKSFYVSTAAAASMVGLCLLLILYRCGAELVARKQP
jgi:hypothetical protein